MLKEDKQNYYKFKSKFTLYLDYDSLTFEEDLINFFSINTKIKKQSRLSNIKIDKYAYISKSKSIMSKVRIIYKDDIILYRRLFDIPIEYIFINNKS